MKKILYNILIITSLLFTQVACNDFLDEVPDNRTEIDTNEKVALLLAGSYPGGTFPAFLNPRVDYVTDKGQGTDDVRNQDSFFWRDVTSTSQDSPEYFWAACYSSVAGANGALDAIEALSTTPDNTRALAPYKGEALILRAFSHFMLGTVFCRFHDPAENGTNMGLPYVRKQETEINRQYKRGTVGELWDNIEQEIEEGLPLIGPDDAYAVPKFHFNKNASYTFASRFYLYKGGNDDLRKTIEVASQVFPKPAPVANGQNVPENDPAAELAVNSFQPWQTTYQAAVSSNDIKIVFTKASNPSNLLICDVTSYLGSRTNTWRYATTRPDLDATGAASNPTGGTWAWANKSFHSGDLDYYYPKFYAYMKKPSVSATTGVYHTMFTYFRIEETLLNRAEAYARLDEYDKAVADMNIYCRARILRYNESANMLTIEKILEYYKALVESEDFYMNKYDAYGSASWSNEKKALVHFILICRQNEFMYEGLRYFDMVRYKMEVTHRKHATEGGQSNTLYPGDDRWVIQIPETAVLSGLELNPKKNILSPEW